jgi:carboxylesterase
VRRRKGDEGPPAPTLAAASQSRVFQPALDPVARKVMMSVHVAHESSRQDAVLLLHGLSGSPLELQYLERRARQAGFAAHTPNIVGLGFAHRKTALDTGSWSQWLDFVSGELDMLGRRHERVYVGGLCIGAVLALRLAIEQPRKVAGLALLSTTLAFDGMRMPWYRVLAPLAYYTPLRRMMAWPERYPFGLKNERLREWVARAVHSQGVSVLGAAVQPLSGIHESQRLIRAVKRDIAAVHAPTLILHAIEDDITSPRNAQFVALNVSSRRVRTILYRDSYHILSMDNEKESVADEMIGFFREASGQEAGSSEQPGSDLMAERLTAA